MTESARKSAPSSKSRLAARVGVATDPLAGMLMPDEVLLRVAGVSGGIYWKGLLLFIVALLIMIKAFMLGAFLMFVSLVMLAIAYLTKYFLILAVTDKRILVRHGIINLDTIQMRHSKIESVELSRTIIGQILGYASVVITGTGSRITIVPFIADAHLVRQAINEILLKMEAKETAP